MKTMNEDDEPDISMAALEASIRDAALATEHESTRPLGYGVLSASYEWRNYEATGMPSKVRAWCLTDGKWMTTTLKVDPRYGQKTSQHTRGMHSVVYKGRPVLSWECRDCGQWVVQ